MKNIFCVLFLFVSLHSFAQELISDNPLINDAFKLAVQTVDINIRRGILAAGGDYGGEWTRDIAINSGNGVSLLRPKVAEKSLWSVTINKDTIGHQYWDKIIWVIAACNHYLVTGDKEFLSQAFICSANTMNQLEKTTFDKNYGLFMGPSVFNDGIAAYPEPIYEPNNYSSGVLDHKNSYHIKCLSTNCVYYGAYLALSRMSSFLNENRDVTEGYLKKAEILKKNILKNFYNSEKNTFNYLIDQNGKVDNSQEGLGISFAVILKIIDGEKANQLIENAVVSKFGITSITPDFPRYSKEMPGRHNNIIWPMVNGFFAKAALVAKNYKTYNHELFSLTHLALDEDKGNYNFREIFNPYSGKPDGGYQAWGEERPNYHWESCKFQTWSATAYISMVINGLFGMKFNEKSLSFAPFLPEEIGSIELKDLSYRDSKLNISIKGKGNTIESFMIDGKKQTDYSISSTMQGKHSISIIIK
jgi:glycogen debranching enzyme